MRKHIPLIISCVALFLSLTGLGAATGRYVVTSITQIAPHVRQHLRGQPGLRGPVGPQGQPGLIAWDKTYFVSASASLSKATPDTALLVRCAPADRALSGGFDGAHQIVTTSVGIVDGWELVAHLDPAASEGKVTAWALCSR